VDFGDFGLLRVGVGEAEREGVRVFVGVAEVLTFWSPEALRSACRPSGRADSRASAAVFVRTLRTTPKATPAITRTKAVIAAVSKTRRRRR
jgi:hypothetical protein